jgi:uncharacterized protein with GYD domain
MAHYMVQFAYTSEAWAALTKHPEDRAAAAEALAEKFSCRFEALLLVRRVRWVRHLVCAE